MRNPARLVAVLALIISGSMTATSASAADQPLEYNRDIRPILADKCFACHGPDSAARKADLRVDDRAAAIDMLAIVPGKPDESEMIARIFSKDEDEQMPPPATKKTLTVAEKEMLRRWIADGAEYQAHWSLIAPVKPPPPTTKKPAWVRNPIDAFVLAQLETIGLTPAKEADRRTLARRVSLDLTGLPPDPKLLADFINDKSDGAYEKYIDKLLSSVRWGEHRGRYWLDVARYADTHGIHFDNYREIWAYRDWVIAAFNRNLPFDQFTIEQLAGDLLPGSTLDQQIASGFNRCNITTNEGGIIDEEYRVLYTRDRTETVGQAWLGLTIGCAVCHDHKFDPVSQREFYEMAAFFNNTTQPVRDGNIKDTKPIVRVPLVADRLRLTALKTEMPAARKAVATRRNTARPEFDKWLSTAKSNDAAATIPIESLYFHAPLIEGQGKTTQITIDGKPRDIALAASATWKPGPSGGPAIQTQGAAVTLADVGDFEKDQAFTCSVWVNLPANDSSGSIVARMDDRNDFRGWDMWVQRRQIGTHVINTWPGNAVKVVGKNQIPANKWVHVAVSYDGSQKASGIKVYYDGKPQPTNVEADKLTDTTRTKVPFKVGQRNTTSPISGAAIHDLRIYKRSLAAAEVASLSKGSLFATILAKSAEERTEAEKQQLYGWWLGTQDGPFQQLTAVVAKLEKEEADGKARGTVAHIMQERKEAATAFILFRGEYDQRRDKVQPNTPAAFPAMSDGLPKNRLGFAKWLLQDNHPLTARVTVNRYWQQVFGTGLVRTAGDFGVAGEMPSHPELLDWLAVDFRESGWDVKRFFKQVVMSATYRQAAIATPEKLANDRDNRSFSRGPRFRIDAEMVRDYALSASGLLSTKIGGPSVKPYQPDGVWEAVAMIGSNTRDYRRDSGDSLYRRSMYTFWKRSAPPASMDIFNAPSREFCTVQRERTNTPLQALVTLNDPQFVEAARVLAERTLKEGGKTDADKANFIALYLLSRPFREIERPIVESSLADLLAYYKANPEDAAKLLAVGESKRDELLDPATHAAWTMLTNQLMNLDEVLNK